MVTPLPRRRPVVVARQTATLDRLSGGRLTLGVGTGASPFEWEYMGEETDHRARGEMLDEHLDLLSRLWTGEPVHHEGTTTGRPDRIGRPPAIPRRCSNPASRSGSAAPGPAPARSSGRPAGTASSPCAPTGCGR